MTADQFIALLPLILLASAPVVLMLLVALKRSHTMAIATAVIGLVLSMAALPWALVSETPQVTSLLRIDGFAVFYIGLIDAAALASALLAFGYFRGHAEEVEEFYMLLLLAAVGAAVLAASSHFASVFLGLEVLSVSLYGLVAYVRGRGHSAEAGIKYLILAAASAAFLLFGMALVYAELGTMSFAEMSTAESSGSVLVLTGMGMIIVGAGFKLALVPFHMWTPDVYQGASAPAAAVVATVSKGGMFALLARLAAAMRLDEMVALEWSFAAMAVASMFGGNLLALRQDNVKRILAYSSIAHLGYLLVALLAASELASSAISFYLTAYFVTTLMAFGVISALSTPGEEVEELEDYRGLFWRRPALAAVLAAALFSLAGIPLTAGFVGKFIVLSAGIDSGLWWLAIALILSSSVGLYYYLRIIVVMYGEVVERAPTVRLAAWPAGAVLTVLTGLLVLLGCYPRPLLSLIESTVERHPVLVSSVGDEVNESEVELGRVE